MSHSREQILYQRTRWIIRRKFIIEKVYHGDVKWWGGLGSLSKNKIHCSCDICMPKNRLPYTEKYSIHRSRLKGTEYDETELDFTDI